MLEQPPTIFVWHPVPILNVQRNNSHFIPIPVTASLSFSAASSSYLHYVSTVQEWNHLFNEMLGSLALWRETGCAVLRKVKRHQQGEIF